MILLAWLLVAALATGASHAEALETSTDTAQAETVQYEVTPLVEVPADNYGDNYNDTGIFASKANASEGFASKANTSEGFASNTNASEGFASKANASETSASDGWQARCQQVAGASTWYLCGDQQLVIDDLVIEVKCESTPLDCSSLPPRSPRRRLQRLKIRKCTLPPSLELSCVAGAADTLTINEAAGSLTAHNVQGLDVETLFISCRPGAVHEIPVEAIRALPRLGKFQMLQGTSLPLSPGLFPPSPRLQHVEVMMGGITSLPPRSFSGLTNLTTLSLYKNMITELKRDALIELNTLETFILDSNPLTSIEAGSFSHTPRLRELHLSRTRLAALDQSQLPGLKDLRTVKLSSDPGLTLGPGAFSRLPSLQALDVTSSRVTSLPADLFLHSEALVNLTLSNNWLSQIPDGVLSKLPLLQRLDVSNNRLTALSSRTFLNLDSLAWLDLSRNQLTELPGSVFSGLRKLSSVSLAHNHISTIYADTFTGGASLLYLSLSHNRLSWAPRQDKYYDELYIEDSSPLNMLTNLQTLDLSHNNISVVYSDWYLVLRQLTTLDLSHNVFTELEKVDLQFLGTNTNQSTAVNLDHNLISSIQGLPFAGHPPRCTLSLRGNPLHCNCSLYDFITRVQSGDGRVTSSDARCSSPAQLAGTPLARVERDDVTCALRDVTACSCVARPSRGRVECECDDVHQIPNISSTGLPRMWLRLRRAPAGDEWRLLPPAVANLSLSEAGLRRAPSPALLPASLRHLDLATNRIHDLPDTIWDLNLTVSLASNPLSCACASTGAVTLLQSHADRIIDYERVACDDGSLLSQKDATGLCDVQKSYVAGSLAACSLIILALLFVLLYAYWVEIQVLLYRKKWLLFLLPKEDADDDKTYDVFVSFAHEDEKFLLNEILPKLQDYTIHVQWRDWEIGGTIPTQIHKSVETSRRTLIVLSKKFLESRWATEGLRTVHAQATHDRRTRAVVILHDVTKKDLDTDTKTFLSLSKFIKYDETLFWDKVRFALPRDRAVPRLGKQAHEWDGGALQVVQTVDGKLVNVAYIKQ